MCRGAETARAQRMGLSGLSGISCSWAEVERAASCFAVIDLEDGPSKSPVMSPHMSPQLSPLSSPPLSPRPVSCRLEFEALPVTCGSASSLHVTSPRPAAPSSAPAVFLLQPAHQCFESERESPNVGLGLVVPRSPARTPSGVAGKARVVCTCSHRLLIADDEAMNRLMARKAFRFACPNATLEVCEDGRAAVAAFRCASDHEPYAAAVLDFEMGPVDGAAAAAAIRQDEEGRGRRSGTQRARLVLWSSLDLGPGTPLRARCEAAGFDAACAKGLTPLVAVVTEALGTLVHSETCPFSTRSAP
eukprot:tig00020710_g13250.t1